MDAFVRRLVDRLLDRTAPLSRNRHFHTFETPEGRRALRITKRLLALARDVRETRATGGSFSLHRLTDHAGEIRIEVRLEHLKSHRTTLLDEDELNLLRQLPDMAEALAPVGAAPL